MATVIRRVGHDRDRLMRAMNGRVTVAKQEDGQYKATIEGQGVEATAKTEEDAIRAAKKQLQETFRQTGGSDVYVKVV